MKLNNNYAINVNEINKLMIEISDCADDIKITLRQIQNLIDETDGYYACSSAVLLRRKHSDFSDGYKLIVDNIRSYNTDLANLKRKYLANISDLSQQIKTDAAKLTANKVYYKEER